MNLKKSIYLPEEKQELIEIKNRILNGSSTKKDRIRFSQIKHESLKRNTQEDKVFSYTSSRVGSSIGKGLKYLGAGALGAGIGSLAVREKRKRLAYLKSKNNPTPEEIKEIKYLKADILNAKVIGSGLLAGAVIVRDNS